MRNGIVTRQAAASVTIGFDDLATVVNGNPDDDITLKPFDRHFTCEKIIQSWEKVGFVPFTRNCLNNKKVRHELGNNGSTVAQRMERIQESYNHLVIAAEEQGLNSGVFDGVIPTAFQLQREAEEEAQINQLLATKGAFCASAHWNICNTRIGNADVVLKAQRLQLEADATKLAVVSQNKANRRQVQLEKAQVALQKHLQMPERMTDRDWVDIIRWVLPESGSDGRMKDLKS